MHNSLDFTPGFSADSLLWCFSTLGCPECDLDGAIGLARRFGIGAIELRALRGTVELFPALSAYREKHLERFRRIADQTLIRMWDSSFCLADAGPGDLERFRETASMADWLQVPYCRVFGGFEYSSNPAPESIRKSAETFRRWNLLRDDRGINCRAALETHDGFSSASNCLRLFDAMGHAVPIVWDAHHTWRYGKESMPESLEKLRENIVHIHVKDSVATGTGEIKSVLPGLGEAPVRDLLSILRKLRFDKPVSLEWERLWEPDLPPLSDALAAVCRHWLRNP